MNVRLTSPSLPAQSMSEARNLMKHEIIRPQEHDPHRSGRSCELAIAAGFPASGHVPEAAVPAKILRARPWVRARLFSCRTPMQNCSMPRSATSRT